MIKTREITLSNEKVITVKEVTVGQFLEILGRFNGDEDLMPSGLDVLFQATGLSAEDINDLTAADLEAVWEAVKELHAFFFKLAQTLELPAILKLMAKQTMLKAFSDKFSAPPAATVQ